MRLQTWCLAALAVLAAGQSTLAAAAPEPTLAADAVDHVDVTNDGAEAGPSAEDIAAAVARFDASLSYRQGPVEVAYGKAALDVPPSFRFLAAADARRVLEDAWGNPPDAEVLGLLVPADVSPIDPERGWGVVITYEETGHIDDADAAGIDFSALLREMQAGQDEANAERRARGFSTVALRGWAEPPHHDPATHKLYWAMRLDFDEPTDTLNYAIRVLGREGVLALNAVAPIERMAEIKPAMERVVEFATFAPGHRYTDYNAATDKLASYGVGGLIAGGLVASKTGLLKGLWLALLAGKKFVVLGLVGACVFVKRVVSGRAED